MSKFIAVDIVKELVTTIYLEVPDEVMPLDICKPKFRPLLDKAVDELDSLDWSKDEDWSTGSIRRCEQKEAEQYSITVITEVP